MATKRRKVATVGVIHLWGVALTPAQQLGILAVLCASLLAFVGSFAVGTPEIAPYSLASGGYETMQPENIPDQPSVTDYFKVGTVLKPDGSDVSYYVGKDSLVHLIPAGGVYATWFSKPKEIPIPQSDFETYGLGAPVRFRPGSVIVQLPESTTLYTLTKGGVLHEITTKQAAYYFGKKWQTKVRVISADYAGNYTIGETVMGKTLKKFDPKKALAATKTIDADLGL